MPSILHSCSWAVGAWVHSIIQLTWTSIFQFRKNVYRMNESQTLVAYFRNQSHWFTDHTLDAVIMIFIPHLTVYRVR